MSSSSTSSTPKPRLKCLDHYTLICHDAKAVAEFHVRYLDYKLLKTIDINTGTVPKDEVDMKNYVLELPGTSDKTLVVTEGLNDDTVFRKYVKLWNTGIHHMAFQVDDIKLCFRYLQEHGIETTSKTITTDLITGLKQVFIVPDHAGFFIELIERLPSSSTMGSSINTTLDTDTETDTNTDADTDTDTQIEKKDEVMESENTTMKDSLHGDKLRNESLHSSKILNELQHSVYSHGNMSDLANSMHRFLLIDDEEEGIDGNLAEAKEEKEIDPNSFLLAYMEESLHVKTVQSIGFQVEDIHQSIDFLLNHFNFRFTQYDDKLGRAYVKLYNADDCSMSFYVEQTSDRGNLRRSSVYLSASEVQLHKYHVESPLEEGTVDGLTITLPRQHTTYDITVGSEAIAASKGQAVNLCSSSSTLSTYIFRAQEDVLVYLSKPENLPTWTGHKAIHYSYPRSQWVETRKNDKGVLTDFFLSIERKDNVVAVSWPERSLSVTFLTSKLTDGITELSVCMSVCSGNQRILGKILRILRLELNLLKSILEGNASCISDHVFHEIQRYHLEIYGSSEVNMKIDDGIFRDHGFVGEICTSGPLLEKMSKDFALTVRTNPKAILRPSGLNDIKVAIQIASELGVPVVVRGSQTSHSAGGQAQSNSLLLDMSTFSFIEQGEDNTVIRIGAGTMWNEVIEYTLQRGYMPPVVNDYQYLSVGGTLSVGGVGFMSHSKGLQAGHVQEAEVVTWESTTIQASSQVNAEIFDLVRGGLGQFGVLTSVNIPLIKAPKDIVAFKVFYDERSGGQHFVEDVQRLTAMNVDMIHAFIKPCTKKCIAQLIGEDKFASAKCAFQETISQGEGGIVYFLELGVYMHQDSGDNDVYTSLKEALPSLHCIELTYFEECHDFITYLRRDPPVVETNKSHGSVPHPSFATVLPAEHVSSLVEKHLDSSDTNDHETNEILIMPLRGNCMLKEGHVTPMFPLPTRFNEDSNTIFFFLLFLGSAIPTKQQSNVLESIDQIRQHLRGLHQHADILGGKRYSYDTITSEQSEEEWKRHFGEGTWSRVVEGKRKYDPFLIFESEGVRFFSDPNEKKIRLSSNHHNTSKTSVASEDSFKTKLSAFEQMIGAIEQSSPIYKLNKIAGDLKAQGKPVYNLGVGNPCLEPPKEILKSFRKLSTVALKGKKRGLFKYTNNGGVAELRSYIANVLQSWQQVSITPSSVVMTPGAQSAIVNAYEALLQPGDHVIVETPFYAGFEQIAKLWKAEVQKAKFNQDNLLLDLESLKETCESSGSKLRVITLCLPSNPSGKLMNDETLLAISKIAKEHVRKHKREVWIMVDATYWRLNFSGTVVPSIFPKYDNSIIVSSFSKDLSLAGERIGYLAVNPLSELSENLSQWICMNNERLGNISSPSFIQHVLVDVIKTHGELPSLENAYKKRMKTLHDGLIAAGMESCAKPDGTFYLFPRLPKGTDDVIFAAELVKLGVLVIPGSSFGAPGYIRVTGIPSCQDIKAACKMMKKVLGVMPSPITNFGCLPRKR